MSISLSIMHVYTQVNEEKILCFFKETFKKIYIFLAVLGLHCCAQAFSSCSKQGLLFVVVRGLLIAVACLCCGARALGTQASVFMARGLSSCGSRALQRRLSSCGAQAQLLHGMWDLPGPGLEPMSPAQADGFLTTAPPGKPPNIVFLKLFFLLLSLLFNTSNYFFKESCC